MRSVYRGVLLIGALACFPSQIRAVTVNSVFMTTGPPDNQCNARPPAVSFAVTDPEVWIYVSVTAAQANDNIKIEWLDGSGTLFATTTFQPVALGTRCFYGSLNTVQNPFRLTAGIWTAHGTWNGADLFLLNFAVTGPAAPTPGGGVSGTWQLTSTCGWYGDIATNGAWQATILLSEAADGSLAGTVQGDKLNPEILATAAGYQGELAQARSVRSGNSFSLILHPAGWISVLALTGTINGNRIDGGVHHYGTDDCTFSMVRLTGGPGPGTAGSSLGAVLLLRLSGRLTTPPAQDFAADLGAGVFVQSGALSGISLPTIGPSGALCQAFSGSLDVGALLTPGAAPPGGLLASIRQLDAGTALSVTGPKGTVALPPLDPTQNFGVYLGLMGGTLPLTNTPALPLYLDPGTYTVAGPGGRDVGAFRASIAIPTAVAWSNPDQLSAVNRSTPITLTWTGGDSTQFVLIAGVSTDQTSKATGGFFCLAQAAALSFTVPSAVLNVLPPSGAVSAGSGGLLLLGSVPTTSVQTFTATGIDLGLVLNASLNLRTAVFQ